MRVLLLILSLSVYMFADDAVSYFKESDKNELLCHVGQHSFKMISHKNATIEHINGHYYFKLIDENFYFLSNACQPLSKKQGIIF
ncbi:hypothetical protein [Sulfurimonas sp.]|uniref:hypothetical protein n=1 Tax=Sulfurimonas sp. TaxID=2022749 RepID=UPI003569D9B3